MKTSSHAESVFTILFLTSSLCNPMYVYVYSYLSSKKSHVQSLHSFSQTTFLVHIMKHNSYYVTAQLLVTINELVNALNVRAMN